MKIPKMTNLILIILLYLSALLMYIFYGESSTLIFNLVVLIVWGISILIWITFYKNVKKNMLFYLLNFALLYILLNVGTFAYGEYLEYKLNQFDLDKDSIFSKEEQTTEQKKYMAMVVNDVSRTFMFIIGGIISIISTFFLFLVIVVFNLISKHFRNTVLSKNR